MKFLQKVSLLLAGMFLPIFLFAQTDALRIKLNSIFQNIDKSQVPTGYLKEYGAEPIPIHCFKGLLTDSNALAGIDAFRATYTDISTAKIQVQLPAMTCQTFL